MKTNSSKSVKAIFIEIRNYLVGRVQGITRDETLIEELLKILFCKLHLESKKQILKEVKQLFETYQKVQIEYSEIFKDKNAIKFDTEQCQFIIEKLKHFSILESTRDIIGDAVEIFLNSSIKGSEGQFFTPKNSIELIFDMLAPPSGSSIIDPACGSGSFLAFLLTSLKYKNNSYHLYGADKDKFFHFVAKAHISLLENKISKIFCLNSLDKFKTISDFTNNSITSNSFDFVVTNPPYGSKIDIGNKELKEQFLLAKKWCYNKNEKNWSAKDQLQLKPAPQVIFIERCLELLKPGGKLGMVLPEGLFSNPSMEYLRIFISQRAQLLSFISFPEEMFKTSGKGGTHTKTCALILEKNKSVGIQKNRKEKVFFARAIKCGHDSRGLPIPYDDLPKISERYIDLQKNANHTFLDHLGFYIEKKCIRDNIWLPKYYDPEIEKELTFLSRTHDLIPLGTFIKKNIIQVKTGDEVGKLAYGTGNIPFIRSSEITNWEIKTDNKHGVSEKIYTSYSKKQDVREHDILMVRDGTYLVGSCAMITKEDLPLIFQSHIYKIRSNDYDVINPFLLLAILSSPCVEKQIYSKRFTQDIIDTLGQRLNELILPIPKSSKRQQDIIEKVKKVIEARNIARNISKSVRWDVLGAEFKNNFNQLSTKM